MIRSINHLFRSARPAAVAAAAASADPRKSEYLYRHADTINIIKSTATTTTTTTMVTMATTAKTGTGNLDDTTTQFRFSYRYFG